jgi:uncharacterized protein YqgC (DUF456 family)
MLFGLFGLIVPIFPGNVVMWSAALVYGLIFGFGKTGGILFGVISILMVIAVFADNLLMGAKARQNGAAWISIILALFSGVLFSFIFPPIGGIIAAPLVLYLVEFLRLDDSTEATKVVKALLVGWGLAFVVRFGIGILMLTLWGIWAFVI